MADLAERAALQKCPKLLVHWTVPEPIHIGHGTHCEEPAAVCG
jgi:hypothetical protein